MAVRGLVMASNWVPEAPPYEEQSVREGGAEGTQLLAITSLRRPKSESPERPNPGVCSVMPLGGAR